MGRGNKFKNNIIEGILEIFDIKRFLSKKECLYDNTLVEVTFKTFKIEFVYPNYFESLE
jgi:hypothetical protein